METLWKIGTWSSLNGAACCVDWRRSVVAFESLETTLCKPNSENLMIDYVCFKLVVEDKNSN